MAVDLLFEGAYTPPVGQVDLLFGGGGGEETENAVAISGTFGALTGAASIVYDNAVPRGPAGGAADGWRVAAPVSTGWTAPWAESRRMPAITAAGWGGGLEAYSVVAVPWRLLNPAASGADARWRTGYAQSGAWAVPWRELLRRRTSVGIPWRIAQPISIGRGVAFEYLRGAHGEVRGGWREGITTSMERAHPWRIAAYCARSWRLPWSEAGSIGPGSVVVSAGEEPSPAPCYEGPVGRVDLLFAPACTDADALWRLLLFGCAAKTACIPRRRAYLVIHDVSLYRASDGLAIAASQLVIGIDSDALAVSWSATLLGMAALEAVEPSLDGEPVTLVAEIDGHAWHLLVEDWTEDRQHGQRSIRASGRGLSGWLAAPYERTLSGQTTSDLTIQQALEGHLPTGSGWTLSWVAATAPWLIPAGAWTWQNVTHMQAIHAAAQGVGLIVVPDPAAKVLTVRERYPVMPWDFSGATPDLVIPDSAILSVSRRATAPDQANAVYVHGSEIGGVLARVYRSGTAGDVAAPTVSHPLITHTDAARLLGARLLAAQQRQPEVRAITLPLGDDFPLAELGDLLAVTLDSEAVRGIVSAVSVEVRGGGRPTVHQTMHIGEDTPNQWAKFRRLLPEDPLLVGTVSGGNAAGTVTVDLVGGGNVRVRGDAAIGATVYIRGGQIEGPAPDLPAFDIPI